MWQNFRFTCLYYEKKSVTLCSNSRKQLDMKQKIDIFLPIDSFADYTTMLNNIVGERMINDIFVLTPSIGEDCKLFPKDVKEIRTDNLTSTATILKIGESANADYVLISQKTTPVSIGMLALNRMVSVADESGCAMLYADHYSVVNGKTEKHPAIDYCLGSIRDDFDFGQLILIRTSFL